GRASRRLFPAHRATGHRRGLPARLHRAGRRPVSTAVLILATLRRVAPAQTLPRGESGPEAGDGSVTQTCSSVQPPPELHIGFGGVRVFKNRILGSASRACLGVQTRSQPRRAFCAGAFLMDFLAGYPVLPIQRSILSRPHRLPAPWLKTPSDRNVTNAPENIVRMKRGKIVTRYRLSRVLLGQRPFLHSLRRRSPVLVRLLRR